LSRARSYAVADARTKQGLAIFRDAHPPTAPTPPSKYGPDGRQWKTSRLRLHRFPACPEGDGGWFWPVAQATAPAGGSGFWGRAAATRAWPVGPMRFGRLKRRRFIMLPGGAVVLPVASRAWLATFAKNPRSQSGRHRRIGLAMGFCHHSAKAYCLKASGEPLREGGLN
jgi:hypothetical protein